MTSMKPEAERVDAYLVMWECLCSDVRTTSAALPTVCPGHGRKQISSPELIKAALPKFVGVHRCPEQGDQCPSEVAA